MSKPTKYVVSANDLFDGDVVYLTSNGTWTRALNDAAVAGNDVAADALLEIANRQPESVIGPYLISINQAPDNITPNHIREKLRSGGPSIFPVSA